MFIKCLNDVSRETGRCTLPRRASRRCGSGVLAARAGMAPAVLLRGDITDRAGIVDLEGAADAIPSSSVAARSGPSRVYCADGTVAPDGPLRAVGDSTTRLEGRGAPTGADAPRGGG